ncbi:MAG: class I tRNA ligase family protein [Candidatus Peribacteria bacterium]|nr:class I tRNA ligase family protein [Candidatus Peribacteria bacterium]
MKKFLDKVIALWDKVNLNDTNECRDGSINRPNPTATTNDPRRDASLTRPNAEGVAPNIEILLHQTIKKTTEDIDAFRFNTTISQFMILVNKLSELDKVNKDVFQTFIILLAPFAPHLAEEFRHLLGNEFSIFTKAQRPTYDEKKLTSDTINLAIQFNGKVRGTIEVSPTASQEEVLNIVKGVEKLNEYLTSGETKKIIYIPGKIMNVVVG